jgi:hypothetical protein
LAATPPVDADGGGGGSGGDGAEDLPGASAAFWLGERDLAGEHLEDGDEGGGKESRQASCHREMIGEEGGAQCNLLPVAVEETEVETAVQSNGAAFEACPRSDSFPLFTLTEAQAADLGSADRTSIFETTGADRRLLSVERSIDSGHFHFLSTGVAVEKEVAPSAPGGPSTAGAGGGRRASDAQLPEATPCLSVHRLSLQDYGPA